MYIKCFHDWSIELRNCIKLSPQVPADCFISYLWGTKRLHKRTDKKSFEPKTAALKLFVMQIFPSCSNCAFFGFLSWSSPSILSRALLLVLSVGFPHYQERRWELLEIKVLLHFGSALRTHRVYAQSTHQERVQPLRETPLLPAGSCATGSREHTDAGKA